ncbi:hypothetical protein C0431_13155 [bacterium]|nr:hypothetical protein [bacterium]
MRKLGQSIASKVTRGFNQANNKIATNLVQAKSKVDRFAGDYAQNTIDQAMARGGAGKSSGGRIKGMADKQAQSVVNNAQKKWAQGFAEGVKPQPRAPRAKASGGTVATPPSTPPVKATGITDTPPTESKFRAMQDIKMAARGEAPATTVFRTREARDAMIKSGEGKDHKFAKGSTSWQRVGVTAAAGYAGFDAVDRMGSGGNLTRNETGKRDIVGIPIL